MFSCNPAIDAVHSSRAEMSDARYGPFAQALSRWAPDMYVEGT